MAMERRWWALGAAGVFVVLAGAAAPVAHAGLGSGSRVAMQDEEYDEDDEMMAWLMSLSIGRDSADLYLDLMAFDDDQAGLAREMYRDYLGQYRDAAEAVKGVYEKLEESMYDYEDQEKVAKATRDIAKVMGRFMERGLELGERYVGDLEALAFNEAQRAGHQRVVRARQRELAGGLMVASYQEGATDLVLLSQKLGEPIDLSNPEDPTAATLLAYENEVAGITERLVTESIAALRAQMEAMVEENQETAWEQYAKVQERIIQTAGEVDDITKRYAQRVAATLEGDRRRDWDKAYNAALYPAVYAPGEFEKLRDAVLKFDSLTDEQRASIASIEEHYDREAVAMNLRWAAALDAAEKVTEGWDYSSDGDYEKFYAEYEKAQAESTAAAQARTDLDERFAERVRALLTAEQREQLPKEDTFDIDAVLRELEGDGGR
jgi:hypothetical protein